MTAPEFGFYIPGPKRRVLLLGAIAAFSMGAMAGWLYPDKLTRHTLAKRTPAAIALTCYAAPAAMHPDQTRPARYAPDSPAFHCLGETSK